MINNADVYVLGEYAKINLKRTYIQADTPNETTSYDRKQTALRERMSVTYKIFLFIIPGGTIFQYMESENEAVKPHKKK